MCEVCAVFGIGQHWTDAGKLANSRLPAPDITRFRVERRQRIALINHLLSESKLKVFDWDGEAYWVERHDGRGERVPNLNALWSTVERLSGRHFDPLLPTFS